MKKFNKILIGAFSGLYLLASSSFNVFAAGSVSAVGDKETAAVGDTFTVTVDVKNDEGSAEAPDISVNYDVNRLSFESCSSEYGGGAGGLITLQEGTSEITFTILSGGQADVDVNAIFDGDGTTSQIVTATVMVDGEDTAAPNEYAREEESTGVEAGSIATPDGDKVVATVFASEFMPVGFYKTTVSYEEQMVEAAQFDMGDLVLLYVTDSDGNNGNFDVYNQETGELSDFLQISGIENRFIIALSAGEDVKVPDGFVKASLQWNQQNLEAYTYSGEVDDTTGTNVSDFFLLYAISSEGNKGFYMYDQNEGTYQRYLDGLHSGAASSADIVSQIVTPVVKEEGSEKGGINILFVIAVSAVVLLLALIIAVIVMAIKLREFNSYEYIDEEEENPLFAQAMNNQAKNPYYEQKVDEDKPVIEKKPVEKKASEQEIEKTVEEKSERPNTSSKESVATEKKADADLEEFIIRDKDDDVFSPRNRDADYLTDRKVEKDMPLSRADKKALKQEEKARKKEEKRLKKEYGEFGPVNWQSWQDAVEGGEKTAASAVRNANTGDINLANDEKPEPKPVVKSDEKPEPRPVANSAVKQPVAPAPAERIQEKMPPIQTFKEPDPKSMTMPIKVEAVKKPLNKTQQIDTEQIKRLTNEELDRQGPKNNPMEMMKNIPANDNKAPVQEKPVQQFDFDDDFEFEFLDLGDDD